MNGNDNVPSQPVAYLLALLSPMFLWFSQPPYGFWQLAMIAVVPWVLLAADQESPSKKLYRAIWMTATIYWVVSLAGLRHAHPAMYVCWIVLAGYLGSYPLLFVMVCRRAIARKIPLLCIAPIAWVGLECVRNYLLTGISALMLGHTMINVPTMVQIADLFGSYGVSFVLVLVNVAIAQVILLMRKQSCAKSVVLSVAAAAVGVGATISYGNYRLEQPTGPELNSFALIQRNAAVEYTQDAQRERKIFEEYSLETHKTIEKVETWVDAVVWPESMFIGCGGPWLIADEDAVVPADAGISEKEFLRLLAENQAMFLRNARFIQSDFARFQQETSPHLLVGCGVIRYADRPHQHSGFVHLEAYTGELSWYGKTHLVVAGEHLPILSSIPGVRNFVPSLSKGPGPKLMQVEDTSVVPNICIETAVERVTVNHVGKLQANGQQCDVIVNITNDGWFDDSTIIDHHLRCTQMVAIACRTPILMAANNGPTAWIDSSGHIVEQLDRGTNGSIVAKPKRDARKSLYTRIGDWPARILALAVIAIMIDGFRAWRRSRQEAAETTNVKSKSDPKPNASEESDS